MPTSCNPVSAAAQAIRTDFRHLANWDANGKNWVKNESRAGNLAGVVRNLCEHHRRDGTRAQFAQLTDGQIAEVQRDCMRDNFLAEQVANALGY